ncbi:IGR protein motif [Spatholobus suberectus]|nr:IGR protein motif [Spatholobus suberectus]
MGMAWLQLQRIITKGGAHSISPLPHSAPYSRFFSKSSPYVVKVGIPEFLNGIGKGVESHVAKLESEIGDFQKLLVTRTLKLKKLGIPCKHRKLILKYTHKYRLGLWRPRVESINA